MEKRISPNEKSSCTENADPMLEHHVYLEWYLDRRRPRRRSMQNVSSSRK